MKLKLIFLAVLCSIQVFGQKITEVKGYAPQMVGKELEILQITDYITMKQERIATTTVKADSSFSCSFYLDETRKLFVKSDNNIGSLLATPGSTYEVVMPNKDIYAPYRPAGNQVQLIFLNLDSTDINYKVIGFDAMVDNFMAKYYTKNNADTIYFVKRLDWFRNKLDSMYQNDTVDKYFKYHRKFTLARIDNMYFNQSRSKYEKFDFYLKNTPVYYQNEAYMEYVLAYYENYLETVHHKTNELVYMGILKSSPTAIFNALGTDYLMQHNFKLREMVMIKILGDAYFNKEYPQSNIRNIVDSLRNHALFPYNKVIASGLYERITDLYEGGKAPDFNVMFNGQMHNLKTYSGKHLYMIFVDPKNQSNLSELKLLITLHQKYNANIRFLMVVVGEDNEENRRILKEYPWEGIIASENSELVTRYKAVTKPYYVLIDRIGYIVQAPALGPKPNGNRQTIDYVFFSIQKAAVEEPK